MSEFTNNQKLLDSVSTATTGTGFDTSMRKKYGVELVGTLVKGFVTFSFLVSNDGINFTTYNRLTSNIADTNTENDTRVASIFLTTSTTSAFILFPTSDYFRYIKADMTVTSGAIVTSSIDAAGTGYSVNDVLTVDDGTLGTITVLTVGGSGQVLTYELTTGGQNYTVDTHEVTGGSGTAFILSVDSIDPGSFSAILQDID